MKLSKITRVFTFFLFWISINSFAGEGVIFYKDTAIEFNGLTIRLIKTFAKERYLKTTISVYNTTNNFAIFNPAHIILILSDGQRIENGSDKEAVIPPRSVNKFGLKYDGNYMGYPTVSFDFSKLQLTEKILSVYDVQMLPLKIDGEWGSKSLKLKITAIDPTGVYLVKMNVKYTGDNFLGIITDSVILKTNDGRQYANTKKLKRKHFDKKKPSENFSFMFNNTKPIVRNKHEPYLTLIDVFKEYSVVTIVGPKITQSISDKIGTEDKDEIEEID
jgi:hypothetical protein